MNKPFRLVSIFTCLIFLLVASSQASDHPKVTLTKAGVKDIRAALGTVPLFDKTVAKVKAEVDAEIKAGIDTPIPKDYSGGYTHERHKRNFFVIQKAGALYQILEDDKYANYVKDMLFQYEAMYKTLPVHPKERSYARGKLFWQSLNDANWLVYVSQAYDAIYDYLSAQERAKLEDNLFRPFADHISIVNPRFFNRIHNHSTWGSAAVGMIGLVMGDEALVHRALYGIPYEELPDDVKNSEGRFQFKKGQKAGFLANLAEPFSPDGYYTEGPYYQRYAMSPFIIFAQALHNAKPDLGIFKQRDGVLLKAVNALVNLSDSDGDFYPLNDGQKGMSYHAREVITAVNVAYFVDNNATGLLSIAQEQGQVLLDDAGFATAMAISKGASQAFEKESVNYSDGADGTKGGLAVLRNSDEKMDVVFKYTSQGFGHGHFDKLSFSMYEKGDEVLQDYGLARYVNIEQKGGGNYLPENNSWAKQTIAHNTLVQNSTSHFKGEVRVSSKHHSDLYFYDDSDPNAQVVSATETNAYPGTKMHRTMAMLAKDSFEKPFVLDIMKVKSTSKNQYDLPFHYMGQVMQTNFTYNTPSTLAALGEDNGYQHLYLERSGKPDSKNTRLSWMGDRRFYTLTSTAGEDDELLFTRLGANDPDFNLRSDAAFIIRRKDTQNTTFVSTIETHGSYNPVTELGVNTRSSIASLEVVVDNEHYTAVSITEVNGQKSLFTLTNTNASPSQKHQITLHGTSYKWTGPYHYFNQ